MSVHKPYLYSIAILSMLGITLSATVPVNAATDSPADSTTQPAEPASNYTTAEQQKINTLREQYQQLDQTPYSTETIYGSPTNLYNYPFRVGTIKSNYVQSSTQWINYYRELVGLPKVTATNGDNASAQLGASVMAGISANPMLSQHSLANSLKPAFIPTKTWQKAQYITNISNLYFRAGEETAGDAITGLIADNNNIDGNDTGHRAWVLSPYLQTIGIGAAYGQNDWKYMDMLVADPGQLTNRAEKDVVTYPSAGVFPIEELQSEQDTAHSKQIPWSIYFADAQQTSGTPTITIQDDTANKSVTASDVMDASSSQYGNYASIYTFTPNGLALVKNHQYTVKITGLANYPEGYSYTVKLFSIRDQTPQKSTKALKQIDVPETGALTIKSAPDGQTQLLSAPIYYRGLNKYVKNGTSWRYFGKTFINGQYFYDLGNNEWVNGRFTEISNSPKQGTLAIDTAPNSQVIGYSSPYYDQQPTGRTFANASTWKYTQVVNVGGINWYNLGGGQWLSAADVNIIN
ncbi:CAP domain-containing protein [Lactobacillus sp. CC-MHH1034]|uniref:CAP domain-containing protein n=1 Tax=Agrilactobacillus fermenti TaxID=2586909 RepID=UPI001E57FC46|nr:CAP domain-containing protein [Agrilactobacillus fermenti]MCD2255554.1 CAP domain-containing protein [Agrilactobacillus fermenti]